jgi:DNA-binding CsgD family transcriptional regulator
LKDCQWYQSHSLNNYGQLAALVFVSDPEAATPSRSEILRRLYGLTPAEARIADLLASGSEVGEVAARSGITLETARFHVKRVLNKTGARRQTELVRLMLSLPGQ